MYKIQEEWLGVGEARQYLFIIEDNSDIKDKLEEKEKLRAIFLVRLIDKYNYSEKDIHLDVDVGNSTIDLMVSRKGKPFIAIDVNPVEIKKTISKAQELGAEYVATITKQGNQFFRISQTKQSISDLPKSQ